MQINVIISGCTIDSVDQKAGSDGNICPADADGNEVGGADPCDGKAAGDACSIHGTSTGACGGDPLACVDTAVCDATTGVADNAHCADTTPADAAAGGTDDTAAGGTDDTAAGGTDDTTSQPAPPPPPAETATGSGASAVAPAAALLLALALY